MMLTPRGKGKLLDFGLAKRIHPVADSSATAVDTESETPLGLITGTVEYMSPEQGLGREVDQRTDIFRLGVLLFNMATSRLPVEN